MIATLALAAVAGVPSPQLMLPDLVQRTPYGLSVQAAGHGRWRLGFESAVENHGAGPLIVEGVRPAGRSEMRASQVVRGGSGGGDVTVPNVGTIRFEHGGGHDHWHLLPFDRYSLRPAGAGAARRDHKEGFCLGDRFKTAASFQDEPAGPAYTSNCAPGQVHLRTITEGISVGYGDDYHAYLEGQSLPLTGLPAGRYRLVHEVNADRRLRESDYANDVAAVTIALSWPRGHAHRPKVRRAT